MSNTTYIHTSDPAQAEAARLMREAVDRKRNEDDQAAYWQNMAQNKVSAQMGAKRFGRNYPATDYREVYG